MLTEEYYSIAIKISCLAFITILVIKLLNAVWFKPMRLENKLREQGFQGNPYKLVFGDIKEKTQMALEAQSKPMSSFSNDYHYKINPFYHHSLKKHGQKCFVWEGPTPIVNIGEPELMRKVYTKMDQFQKLLPAPVYRIFRGLSQLDGDEWAKHRKILNPAFRMDMLKSMIPAFITSSVDMLNKWEKICGKEGSSEVNVWPYLRVLSADAISRAAFGSSYQEGDRIFELITEQINLIRPLIKSIHIPGWRFVPTKRNWRIMTIQREIRALLRDIIIKRQKLVHAGEKHGDDLLEILLASNNNIENNGQKKKLRLCIEEVIDECKTFYTAGQGTTSTLLVWTLILMSKHQEWQELARKEAFTTFGNNTPNFLGLNNLKLLNMILQEVLRLYPPIPATIRRVSKEVKLGDSILPEGVKVKLSNHVQQDENLWGADAKEFNPNRFKDGLSKASGGNVSLFSFGWGPRNCIGSNFAMLEAKVVLVMILQRFSLKLSPSYAHAPTAKETLQPQFGAQLIVQPLAS
ncbi:hypothetical protein KSS87_006444 [Heliosperma pusillum]|nr:hypothetical protein KSS87_006444 [Heliosperma pusillum]